MGEAILVKGLQVAKREVTEEGQPEKMGQEQVNRCFAMPMSSMSLPHAHPQHGGCLNSSVVGTKSHASGQVQGLAQGWHSMRSC